MISFLDRYNALIIDRFSSKTKLGKDLWHFNNSTLKNKDFCSTTKDLISFLKTKSNNYSSISDWWEYTKAQIKENARSFSKNYTKQENIRISRLKKRLRNLYKKNFKLEIKPVINNLQDELYSLECKHARGAIIRANVRWDLEGEKCSKSFFRILERQNMQNQTISELYTDDKKSKFLATLKTYLNLQKKIMEISIPEKKSVNLL